MKPAQTQAALSIEEYARLDAVGLGSLIAKGEVSAAEVAASAHAAVAKANPTVKAVVEVYPDSLTNPHSDQSDGPFKGVPFLIKDVGEHFAGRKLENCSRLCEGFIVAADSNFGTLVKASGVNLLGRSATPEFSMALCADSILHGATSNPWKLGYSTSGSSGGAAAAVMSGMVPMAHASDLGGSTRGPAAWCGGVGLHPSRGRISSGPGRDEGCLGMSQPSVITRTVRDTATMLQALCRPCPGDPFIIRQPDRPYTYYLNGPPQKLRIGWSTDPLMAAPVDPEIAAKVHTTAQMLERLGHHVENTSPTFDLAAMDRMLTALWYFRFDCYLDAVGARSGRKVGTDTVEAATLRFYDYAKGLTTGDYFQAAEDMNRFRRQIGRWFKRYDIWLSPTCAQVAQPSGIFGMNIDVPPLAFLEHEQAPCQFMTWANVCGAPAISLPLGIHSNGLPIGVQLSARPGHEEDLIGLSAELEQAMPWAGRLPKLHVTSV